MENSINKEMENIINKKGFINLGSVQEVVNGFFFFNELDKKLKLIVEG